VDLGRELARRLGVAIELVRYDAAGKVVEGLKSQAWDVCFLAIDPLRAADISFTAPYAVIEGVYLVADASPIRSNAEVDRPGVREVPARLHGRDEVLRFHRRGVCTQSHHGRLDRAVGPNSFGRVHATPRANKFAPTTTRAIFVGPNLFGRRVSARAACNEFAP